MNTKPIPADSIDRACQIERVDDDNRTYLCCKDSRIVWIHPSGEHVFVCPACHRWLQILESLDRPL